MNHTPSSPLATPALTPSQPPHGDIISFPQPSCPNSDSLTTVLALHIVVIAKPIMATTAAATGSVQAPASSPGRAHGHVPRRERRDTPGVRPRADGTTLSEGGGDERLPHLVVAPRGSVRRPIHEVPRRVVESGTWRNRSW